MKANVRLAGGKDIVSGVLAGLAAILILAEVTDRNVPLISDDRGAFIALAIVGFALCSLAITPGPGKPPINWWRWNTLLESALGVLALLVIFAVLADRALPFVSSYQEGFVALAMILLTKWGIAQVYALLAESSEPDRASGAR